MGYTLLAYLMTKYSELAIFRSFSDLNVKNLLYYQAELIELENELKLNQSERGNQGIQGIEKELLEGCPNLLDCDWKSLKMATSEDGEKSQWELFQEIRVKLKEYSKSTS
jgi:hypothetical protein